MLQIWTFQRSDKLRPWSGNRGKVKRLPLIMPTSSAWSNVAQTSHPLSNNRVMVNKEVNTQEDAMVDKAATNRVRETRPSPSNNPSLRLGPLNLPLLPLLQLSTCSSSDMGTLHPPSRSLLHHPHHSTQALTKLFLWHRESVSNQPSRPSSSLRGQSVPLTLNPSRNTLLLKRMKSLWIGLGMRTTWTYSWRSLQSLVCLGPHTGMCTNKRRTVLLTLLQWLGNCHHFIIW